jgi:hypothetical protein
MSEFLKNPSPHADYIEYSIWILVELKQSFDGVAEYLNLSLPTPALPAPRSTWLDQPLFALRATLDPLREVTDPATYRARTQQALVSYLERQSAYGRAMEEAYIDEVGAYLKKKPVDADEADNMLEAHVLAAGPDEDEALIRLLYADVYRRCFLLAVPGSPWCDALLNPLPRIH